jgi:hypothetical protein
LRTLVNLSLVLISILVSLFICEYVIRIVVPQNLSGTWIISTDKGLLVNKSSGTSRHQDGKRTVIYKFYEPHFRDTPLNESSIKILVVGDSFTFGYLLDKKDTFVYHLQEYADKEFGREKFCFLNAGTGGWGTADYVAFIEDFGEIIKPDMILVIINRSDIERSIEREIFTLTSKTELDLKRNILKSSYSNLKKFANSVPGYQWILEHSHLVQLLRNRYVSLMQNEKGITMQTKIAKGPSYNQSDASRRDAIILGKALFARLKKWCDTHKVNLCITTTGWRQLEDANNAAEPTRSFMATAQEFFTTINVPFYDILPRIIEAKEKTQNKYILPDGHPNEEGNRLIAEKIWQYFLKQQLVKYYGKTSQ